VPNHDRGETVRNELQKEAQKWAAGNYDPRLLQELRHEAILLNHAHYQETIPVYQKLTREEGIGKNTDIATIKRKLSFTDGIFKSYQQEWLDIGDFKAMSQWLDLIFHKRINLDVSGISSLDEWADRLENVNIKLVFSSGTSGTFSFVPHDKDEWKKSRDINISCLAPLLASRVVSSPAQFFMKVMSLEVLIKSVLEKGLPDYEAVFLGFRRGRMGNQALIMELASLFRHQSYLYDMDIPAAVLRSLARGVQGEKEQVVVDRLQNEISGNGKERNYQRIIQNIRESTTAGRRVFIFGAPYQFKELCEIMSKLTCTLNKGSLALFGGGWKSFSGEMVLREALVSMISKTFGLSEEMILEGYSMTEINILMLRCKQGCFHIPPIIEPVLYDEELNPKEGNEGDGRFGFLDPLAVSYPGFIISGDMVHMVDSKCECGLRGPAITEIGRVQGQEIKGCGGIMNSMRA
jgi:hypothetical protein